MNLQTIKENMQPIYYNHWIRLVKSDELTETAKTFYLKKALEKITFEINEFLLVGIEFQAEKELLTRLLTKSFEIKNGKWIETKFNPEKKQIKLYDFIGQKMLFKGIGQY